MFCMLGHKLFRRAAVSASFHTSTWAFQEAAFNIAPGGLLHITCQGANVAVTNAPSEESVTVQVDNPASSSFIMEQLPGGRIIDVVELPTTSSSSSSSSSSSPAVARLCATIPSRYCSLSVSTAGGAVSVAQLQEAELQLATAGGAVTLQRCRATHAAISSSREPDGPPLPGGAIEVGELSASSVRLRSGGGAISVRRLFGLELDLLSGGGRLTLGALYGNKAAVSSGGGALQAAHVACEGLAMLDSGGGPLAVEGCEGNASLLSGGGPVKVHLHERFGHVFVDSAGGDVEALLSPAAAVKLQVAAGGGVELDPRLRVTGEFGPTTLTGTTARGAGSSSSTWQPHSLRPAVPTGSTADPAHAKSSSSSGGLDSSADSLGVPSSPLSSSLNASRLHRASAEVARFTAAGSSSSALPSAAASTGAAAAAEHARQLVINAGRGRVRLRAAGWMEGVLARLEQRKQQQQQQRTAPGADDS